MAPTGISDTSNPIPMALTSGPLRWHASAVKSTLVSDGVVSTNGPRMPTWEGDTPPWMIEMSKRFNAALRHSVGCVQDKKGYQGILCDEAGWVNVGQILKYDHIWKDGHKLAGTTAPDYDIISKRWDNFQQIILTEFKANKKGESPSVSLESHKRRTGEGHSFDQPIHKRNQHSGIEVGDWQR